MKRIMLIALVIALAAGLVVPAAATAGDKHRIAWSHYTGWEPWDYADASGILKKWADKFDLDIELVLVNDYIESINL